MQQEANDGGDVVPTIEKYEDVQLVFEVVFLSVSQIPEDGLDDGQSGIAPSTKRYYRKDKSMLHGTCSIHHRPTSTITETSPLETAAAKGLACVPELVVVNGHISDLFEKKFPTDTADMSLQLCHNLIMLMKGSPNNFCDSVLFLERKK
jgi:hypothetical protein